MKAASFAHRARTTFCLAWPRPTLTLTSPDEESRTQILDSPGEAPAPPGAAAAPHGVSHRRHRGFGGGLEAFTELLKYLAADSGMGFVLVQHLDPIHESALTHLLARATKMLVREVTNNLRVAPDCVYVIPPNTCMAIAGGGAEADAALDAARGDAVD